jgi:hypothetical protein
LVIEPTKYLQFSFSEIFFLHWRFLDLNSHLFREVNCFCLISPVGIEKEKSRSVVGG